MHVAELRIYMRQSPIPTEIVKGTTKTLVLAILREGPSHGYAITFEIEKRTGSAVKFRQGTLYPILHELERDGMIVGEWRVFGNERPKKTYTITDLGRAELARGREALQRMSLAMQQVLGEVGGESA